MGVLYASSKEFMADIHTPVSAYLKLCHQRPHSFLFESGESVDQIGRFSIVAWDPLVRLHLNGKRLRVTNGGESQEHTPKDFFEVARSTLNSLGCDGLPELPFVGSLVGYMGYDVVRLIERLADPADPEMTIADLSFSSRIVIFDHLMRKMIMVAIATDPAEAKAKLGDMATRLRAPLAMDIRPATLDMKLPPKERFVESVKRAKEYIMAGDIFQVVLSDQFIGQSDLDPFSAYRVLRTTNPSPYMFFLDLGESQLAGASPETMVSVDADTLRIRPIAGTRGRSNDPVRDQALEAELMESEKERAEHVMLVDLARNDAGRVSKYNTIEVDPYMVVERYSHVMHIVSAVTGTLRPELDIWDVFKASFPAGTVSGAPKVRAMEIIDELEFAPRGPYAGAVGRFGPGPQMDTCIAIRMIGFSQGKITLQAGAGIVADSSPEMEYQEMCDKAAQGIEALQKAARGLM